MGDYRLLLNPLLIGAAVLAPLAWLRNRKQVAHQLLFAMTTVILLLFFVPVLSTPFAKFMSPTALWRLPWVMPVSVTLAFGCHSGARWMREQIGSSTSQIPVWGRLALSSFLPTVLVLAVLAGGLLVRESSLSLIDRGFFIRTSATSFVPFADRSIFLGGIEGITSADWRRPREVADVVALVESRRPEGAVLLAPLLRVSQHIPGTSTVIEPVDFYFLSSGRDKRRFITNFYNGTLSVSGLERGLQLFEVDFVLAGEASQQEEMLEISPMAERVAVISPYVLYEVKRNGSNDDESALSIEDVSAQ